MTHILFRSMLFNLQIFCDFPNIFMLLRSNLTSLWSKSKHDMIPILLNVLRSVLRPRMWSFLVTVALKMCTLLFLDRVTDRYHYIQLIFIAAKLKYVLNWFSAYWICSFPVGEYWSFQVYCIHVFLLVIF